jgi:hypothetical protein
MVFYSSIFPEPQGNQSTNTHPFQMRGKKGRKEGKNGRREEGRKGGKGKKLLILCL